MKRLLVLFMTLCMLTGLCSVGVYAEESLQDQEEGWVDEPDPKISGAYFEESGELVNGKLYYLLRTSDANLVGHFKVYNLETKQWSDGEVMPEKRTGCKTVSVGNYIYVLGGSVGGNLSETMLRYDTVTNQWETLEAKPVSRISFGVVSVGNKIYVIGGYASIGSNTADLNSVVIYDTENATWSSGAPMKKAKKYIDVAYEGGKIYVPGGHNNAYPDGYTDLEIYDIAKNEWTKGADIPIRNYFMSIVSTGDKLYAISGSVWQTKTFIYDIKSDKWEQGINIKRKYSNGSAMVYKNRIYIIGPYLFQSLKLKDVNNQLYLLLNVGETVQLSVTNNLSDNKSYKWISNNEGIATVDLNGNVTALTEGTTVIYVQNEDGSFKESIPVKVIKGNADSYRLAAHVNVGKNIRLYLSDDPSSVQWTSMDESVATVSSLGEVTAISKGLAIIKGVLDGQEYFMYIRVNV